MQSQQTDIPKHGPDEVARRCGIQRRQAQNVIRSVLGAMNRYRLTDDEVKRITEWHKIWGKKSRA